MASTVYFKASVDREDLVTMLTMLPRLTGNVAVKVHSGEKGNQNFLRPEYVRPVVELLHGTIVECNAAYAGARDTTEKHRKLMHDHGWNVMPVDIMDSDSPDFILDIPNGNVIKKDFVGNHLQNYDSMLVISHFKGHAMGGYGGALKQLSIGCASAYGKMYIHGAGDPAKMWTQDQLKFLGSMADAASAVCEYFRNKGGIGFVNVMKNISVDCDCAADAEPPCMKDIGILASTDPVALDWACLDLIKASNDPGKEKLLDRIDEKQGMYTPRAAESIGLGTRDYHIVTL